MQIIPVIDLKNGQVVHAVRGERDRYQPIQQHSILTASSDIFAVLTAFLKLHAFNLFYIADLNAITGNGHHQNLLTKVLAAYPDLTFWVDNGRQLAEIDHIEQINYKPVIGTESQLGEPVAVNQPYILSLDYRQTAQGCPAWFSQTQYWPAQLLVMTLDRVGNQQGPDYAKLAQFCQAYPEKQIYAAGGVRDHHDLQQLQQLGVAGVLVATALHQGCITRFADD